MSAAELGQKLLQWGAAEWNQDPVTVQRVRESKKNKGKSQADKGEKFATDEGKWMYTCICIFV